MVVRRPVRKSRDVMSRRSNRPQHDEALYFPHRRLWITEYSCKRPQDQGLPKTSAWSANPSSSGSRASYRKTRKALSPSSSVCFGTRGRRAGGACHRRQLALESGVESEDLEVPLSVHTPAGTMKDYDAILGLDWLEEHYALVDCRQKKIVFRIPGVVGDVAPLEETVETDSERRD
ncbi:hypothetical protein Taro_022894 [Colocasia esculenta]|uniref:Uncharacterized protein n=1 Tax=Colocasia esculenta TaxID=4460 RepID=A0A843V2H4_COLES|nr:hypothetical protein [Colocasia esculenta]